MFSILIPTYNVCLRSLVNDLLGQARQLNIPFEIIIEDDASPMMNVREENLLLSENAEVAYVQNETNKGRSKVRNHLASLAQYPYLIVMDCDASVRQPDYISQYLQYVNAHVQDAQPFVVLGGVAYRNEMPEISCRLRWKYGCAREQKSAQERNRNPFKSFTPFNMLATKSVFDVCRFDESLSTYGFEDTFFGEELRNSGVRVEHVDNALYHDGLDANEIFLNKVEVSIDNLCKLLKENKLSNEFISDSRLLSTYFKCERFHVSKLVQWTLSIHRKALRGMILNRFSLKAMDCYKLLCLCEKAR